MVTRFHDWYDKVRPELSGNGLWLHGHELNRLPATEYEQRPLRVLFARLSTFDDTVDSFTHQLLYQIAAGTDGVFPDLTFLPPPRDAARFGRDGVPWLLGTQTKLGPAGFDLIGFSNSVGAELVNLPIMLERSGIPLTDPERLQRADVPIILLGGANALYASCVWIGASFVDAVFVGEGTVALRRILEICRDAKNEGRSKPETLARLAAEVPGLFIPADSSATHGRAVAQDLDRAEALESGPVPLHPDRIGSGHLQISEGCPCFCGFCAQAWLHRPYRERSRGVLLRTALQAKAHMGLSEIDLFSFNFNQHSEFYRLLWDLVPLFRRIGLKSQRFDALAHDPGMVAFLRAVGKSTFSCGLEGISPRLRRYLHKNISEPDLAASLRAILSAQPRELKIFLIATGLEADEDFLAFAGLLGRIGTLCTHHARGVRIIFSMTPLVRFPWTPLEFEDAPDPEQVARIIDRTAGLVRARQLEFRESADVEDYRVSQILARAADPRVQTALLQALRETGFVYYRKVSAAFAAAFEQALCAAGLDPAVLRRGISPAESGTTPWVRIEPGVRREFLVEAATRAREFREVDYCLGRTWANAACATCGACDSPEQVATLTQARQTRPFSLTDFEQHLRGVRDAEAPVAFRVSVGDLARGAPRQIVGVALARALMLAEPALIPWYRDTDIPVWANDEAWAWVTGADLACHVWLSDALPQLQTMLDSPDAVQRVNRHLDGWATLLGLAPDGWTPHRLRVESPFPFDPGEYLRTRRLNSTLRRTGTDAYLHQLTPDARRRKVLRGLTYSVPRPGTTLIEVEPGSKFSLGEFIDETVRFPAAHSPALLRIVSE